MDDPKQAVCGIVRTNRELATDKDRNNIENSNKYDLAVVGKDLSSGSQSKKISEYISLNSKSSVLYIPN